MTLLDVWSWIRQSYANKSRIRNEGLIITFVAHFKYVDLALKEKENIEWSGQLMQCDSFDNCSKKQSVNITNARTM